ncbi:SGNH/GDSL hydrolase family protein [Bacteroides acidifaciens]|uniref:SGNH/GDSL hydrolase family protein n=1 Tax=Bacteroides acidifaciens TaxID=85831 RepID=UPI00158E287A|nr:SGNH/GDSL hydrolase family protein [Bacteroides acidifaciens]MDE6821164.1 SGNH/GDSL hydrolase family protein [Bacteroides acidifaciens]
MRKNNLLPVFILILAGILTAPCFLLKITAQDRIPACPPLGKTLKKIKPLREMTWANDTISAQVFFPTVFRETGRNEIIDSIALLAPVFEHIRQVHAGLSEDTVRIVHIGDSHVRGHIYPQTTGARLTETFGAVSYIDKGVNGATCLTFTHPDRIAEIAALKPELLILSFGTNESHNRRYSINVHYNQMDELVKLLRDSLPNVPILFTTPPGSYESFRQRRRRRTYAINPRTATAAETIRRYAKNNRLLVWDMYDVVGGKRRACTNWTEAKLMRPDHVHYLPEGYILQGNLLYQAIIKAYNDYVSH